MSQRNPARLVGHFIAWLPILAIGTFFACATAGKPTPPAPRPAPAPAPIATVTSAPATVPADLSVLPLGQWVSLFDGESLTGWRILTDNAFVSHGQVRVDDGRIILERGRLQTGIGWQGEFPRDNYEVSLEAMRVDGGDFFCGMTFSVGSEPCTLIVGGWGGSVVGLSNVNDMHAAENETTTGRTFRNNRWYMIRLRVTTTNIAAWIDDNKLIDLPRENRRFSVWWEQKPARPFGFAAYDTTAALRNIQVKLLENK